MRLAITKACPSRLPTVRYTSPVSASRVAVTQSSSSTLAKRWTELQGCNNWEGLLDPLDDSLRAEILRYGKFAQSAYDAFEFDVSSDSYATSRYRKQELLLHSGMPDSGYVPTRNLHATSGIQLPRWVDRAPSWMSIQSSWIGYVAVADDPKTISRLGRRDIVIAYRGTVTCLEWLENLRSMLTQLPGSSASGCLPMVESGFWSLFTSRSLKRLSLCEAVRDEVRRLLKRYKDEPISITVTGHSLGAALAVLTAYDITMTFRHKSPPVTVYSFAGPRVGNESFRRHMERQGSKVLRIVNSQDVITKVPGIVLDDEEESPERCQTKSHLPVELLKSLLDTRWDYVDVGQELRLSTLDCPDLSRHAGNVAKCHDLDMYLNLVSGYSSSTCPFKVAAKAELSTLRRKSSDRKTSLLI
ncbi:phospholipase A(1) DAD1, chloroplastic-like [Aristolochia californica]|uniref:phospholipase A(1) DAD1, chloroplastic-like n=1 Tax=Aristolochia californica TaxID=171875 RepID=UPI0035E06596